MESVSSKQKTNKPTKPYPDFPLFPHATKRWAKKIRGKHYYFGPWSDPYAALEKYQDQRDDLYAGRSPRSTGEDSTVRDLCNHFLTSKKRQCDTGEITERTFGDYHTTCGRIIDVLGKDRPVDDLRGDDFETFRMELAKTRGPVALGNEIQRVRVVFNYAYNAELIDKPIRYGPTFKRPSKKVLRKARQANGPKMFEAHEVHQMLDAAPVHLQAMILLGINCGFGNQDVATLPKSALDLSSGWVDYPRPKTAVLRRCPLWAETIKAIGEALKVRPDPKNTDHEGRVFITKYGQPWETGNSSNPISAEFRKLVQRLGIYRPGVGFYALRHTFQTIGGESKDQVAVNCIMGHEPADMASVYLERISDERLIAVTDHVRAWVFKQVDNASALA